MSHAESILALTTTKKEEEFDPEDKYNRYWQKYLNDDIELYVADRNWKEFIENIAQYDPTESVKVKASLLYMLSRAVDAYRTELVKRKNQCIDCNDTLVQTPPVGDGPYEWVCENEECPTNQTDESTKDTNNESVSHL